MNETPYTILVVDDDRDIVETLQKRLVQEGYRVVTAFDGDEALAQFDTHNPDLLLLDLMMPARNGFEVLKEVRQRSRDRWRPVIIVSASADLESIKKSYDMDADHYLTKPCNLNAVLSGIRTMISLIPARRENA
jgi:DNA-binding response OmpR family regulator